MELQIIWRVLRRRWLLILIPMIVAAILILPDFLSSSQTTSGGFTTNIRYSAAQEFNFPNRDGDYQDVWLASEFTVNAFAEWVRTSSFRNEVQNNLGGNLDLSPLVIQADNSRSVGVIYLSYPSAPELDVIAQSAQAVLQNANQTYFPQLGGDPAQVTILDEPIITPAPAPLTNRFAPLIRLGVALVIGLGLGFLAEYLDQRIHDREDLETSGIPVLISIP